MPETLWMDDDKRNGYHDQACSCPDHCRNCFDDLAYGRSRGSIGQRSRYCSDWCRNRAKRERALDRALSSHTLNADHQA